MAEPAPAPDSRAPRVTFARPALPLGVVTAVVLLVSMPLAGLVWFVVVQALCSVLIVAMLVVVLVRRRWSWTIVLLPGLALLQPVWPVSADWTTQTVTAPVSALLVLVVGVMVRVPKRHRQRGRRALTDSVAP
ncbi:hypothetical protein Acsp02_64930 [Actinoplanes sp. NBRC 103695]|nr:hypothetical protein Acsp02_64930 [Actinoplanes sp. NBRC 103695]